jgi:hypothetical protein
MQREEKNLLLLSGIQQQFLSCPERSLARKWRCIIMTTMPVVMKIITSTLNLYFSGAKLFLESHFKIHYLLATPMTASS